MESDLKLFFVTTVYKSADSTDGPVPLKRKHEVMFFTGYRDYNYRGFFIIFTDAAALVSQLTMDEIKQLEAETDVVKDEKREIFGPDGKPIDLSQFGQVQIDPKYVQVTTIFFSKLYHLITYTCRLGKTWHLKKWD